MEDLTLHTKKITPIGFELAVEGIKNNPSSVRFVVENPDYDVAIPCKRDADGKWSVDVPPLAEQKGKQYKYRIEVIVDGLFFEPVKGNVILQSEEPAVKIKTITEDKKPIKHHKSAPKPPKQRVLGEDTKQKISEPKRASKQHSVPEDKPIPSIEQSISSSEITESDSAIPSLKSKIVENIQKKDPKYIEEREKKVRAVLDQIK